MMKLANFFLILAVALGLPAEVRAASAEAVLNTVKHFITGTPTPAPKKKKSIVPNFVVIPLRNPRTVRAFSKTGSSHRT